MQRTRSDRQRPRRAATAPAALARAKFPAEVVEVLETLDRAGHRSWLVGGAVRDVLLRRRRAGSDFDVATPATPRQVMALFRKVIPTGIDHGTVTVLAGRSHVEVTTFRGEGEYRDGRRPSSVTFLTDIDGDLARRDFTMNAMAWDPIARELRDPFGGRDDLARGLIRAVGDPVQRFAEDGLRPFRAVRFAAQLGFALERLTERAIPGALTVTAKVSAERICEEISRLLLAPDAPRALVLMERTGLLALVFPGVAMLDRGSRSHAVACVAAARPDRAIPGGVSPLALRLAALLHPLAVAEPAEVVSRGLRDVLTRLRFPSQVADDVAAIVREHGCFLSPSRETPPDTDAAIRRWLSRVGPRHAPAVLALGAADARALPAKAARTAKAELQRRRARVTRVLRARPPLTSAELELNGARVMAVLQIPPGPAVGDALKHLLDRVLEEPSLNTPAALESELRAWWSARGDDRR
ncbi:MAG TPA: tRNA cytidylyltransferase [Anaeromyxobacteraceae bacterium]|nr:tRNA cytidylyltransferase [Anaeromyxobacteraceae bacterium]